MKPAFCQFSSLLMFRMPDYVKEGAVLTRGQTDFILSQAQCKSTPKAVHHATLTERTRENEREREREREAP